MDREGTSPSRAQGAAEPPPSARRPAPTTRDTRSFPQKRARATYDALIGASAEVFAEKGFDATQTPDIAQRAGVSVGTFYRYFADKRQAFIEMIETHLELTYERVMSMLTPDAFAATRAARDKRATIDHVIDVLFQNTAEQPGLNLVFLSMSMRDTEVAHIRTQFEERGRLALAALIEAVVSRDRIADALAAAEVIQVAAQEVALASIGGHGGPKTTDRAAALRAALAEMLYRYVFGSE